MAGISREDRLAEILAKSLSELLPELGVKAERLSELAAPPPQGEGTVAFTGFASADLRGSFTLVGPTALFDRLHPLPVGVTPRDLADWARELVNQAGGRFRSHLLDYGVSLALGVPQSAPGEQARPSSRLRSERPPIAFAIEDMVLEGWLELDMNPDFEIPEQPSAEQAALQAGSVVFF